MSPIQTSDDKKTKMRAFASIDNWAKDSREITAELRRAKLGTILRNTSEREMKIIMAEKNPNELPGVSNEKAVRAVSEARLLHCGELPVEPMYTFNDIEGEKAGDKAARRKNLMETYTFEMKIWEKAEKRSLDNDRAVSMIELMLNPDLRRKCAGKADGKTPGGLMDLIWEEFESTKVSRQATVNSRLSSLRLKSNQSMTDFLNEVDDLMDQYVDLGGSSRDDIQKREQVKILLDNSEPDGVLKTKLLALDTVQGTGNEKFEYTVFANNLKRLDTNPEWISSRKVKG